MWSFFKPRKKSVLDSLDELTVCHYKKFADSKLSDFEILETVQTTMRAFREASEAKQEHISGENLLNIATFFVMFRANSSKTVWLEHLNKEIEYYLSNGIRDTYLNGLSQHHKMIR